MTKDELQQEYEEKLQDLQRSCDHMFEPTQEHPWLKSPYGSGRYYATCGLCDAELHATTRIVKGPLGHREVAHISQLGYSQRDTLELVLCEKSVYLSDVEVEKQYQSLCKCFDSVEFSLKHTTKGPMSTWKSQDHSRITPHENIPC